MIIPRLQGVIDRRMLVNFTADPSVVHKLLPKPFVPQLFEGKAIVGICLIRLKQIRLKGWPAVFGLSSENGAHRIAVEWQQNGTWGQGVFIPRRDTSSWLNAFSGNRIFPGKHYHAFFQVTECSGHYNVAFKSSDGTSISVAAHLTNRISEGSVFRNVETASNFFKNGAVGYSPNGLKYEGIKLKTDSWNVQPLEVSHVSSSYFEDHTIFPKGSIQFDNALLMTGIQHEWESVESKHHCS